MRAIGGGYRRPRVIFLKDNDFLIKLAAWNLLDEAMGILRAKTDGVRVLDTLRTQLEEPRPDWQAQYGDAVLQKVLRFVSKVAVVDDLPFDEGELLMIGLVPKIDAGEALLFAVTKDLPTYRIVTGDKQCLYVLHGATTCKPVMDRVRGNILHLEQVVYRLLETKGLNAIRDKIRHSPAPDADLAIRGAFGQRWEHGSASVNGKMVASIRQLHNDCGGLLDLSDTERDPFAAT